MKAPRDSGSPKRAKVKRPSATQRARAQERQYVSQGRSVEHQANARPSTPRVSATPDPRQRARATPSVPRLTASPKPTTARGSGPAKSHGSAERQGRLGEPMTIKGRRGGRKGAPIVKRTFRSGAEVEAYVERLEQKHEARKQGYADAAHEAAERTKKIPAGKVDEFRARTKQLREQAVKDATETQQRRPKPGAGGKGPLPHRSASPESFDEDVAAVRDQRLKDAPKQARSELGVERKRSDPVRRRAVKRGRARVRKRVVRENLETKKLDDAEIQAQGYVTGSRHDKGLEAGAVKRQVAAERKAIADAKAKRRGGGPVQIVKNLKAEGKDALAGLLPGIVEQGKLVAENAAGLAEAVAHPAASKAKGEHPTPRTEKMVHEMAESSPAYALAQGDVKEALGRAKERPLNAAGEALMLAAPVVKGVQATRAAATVRKAGDRVSVHNVREELRAVDAERRARPALVAEQDRPHRPGTAAGKVKAKAKARTAKADAKARARAAARGEVHDRPEQAPGTVSTGQRTYARNAAVRTAQKATDTARARGGRDPNVASGRRAKKVRKRSFDKRVRNLQAAGIGREEAVMQAVREAYNPLESRGPVERALRGRGEPGRAAQAAVELLVNNRVHLGPRLIDDLRAVRRVIDEHDSEHRSGNLALLDELIDDAGGGEGIFRDPEVRRAARILSTEGREGDRSQARTAYGDPEALEFVRLLQGPAARGEVVRRRGSGGSSGGGGGNPTPPGWRSSGAPSRSIMDEVAPTGNQPSGVMLGERGGGMNPGERPPRRNRNFIPGEEQSPLVRRAPDPEAKANYDAMVAEFEAKRGQKAAAKGTVSKPGTTRVMNLKNDEAQPGDVRIDRKTEWGNPFRIGPDGDRDAVVEKYKAHLWKRIQDEGQPLIDKLAALKGKRLACHCAPAKCHGHVLAAAAEWAAKQKSKPVEHERAPIDEGQAPDVDAVEDAAPAVLRERASELRATALGSMQKMAGQADVPNGDVIGLAHKAAAMEREADFKELGADGLRQRIEEQTRRAEQIKADRKNMRDLDVDAELEDSLARAQAGRDQHWKAIDDEEASLEAEMERLQAEPESEVVNAKISVIGQRLQHIEYQREAMGGIEEGDKAFREGEGVSQDLDKRLGQVEHRIAEDRRALEEHEASRRDATDQPAGVEPATPRADSGSVPRGDDAAAAGRNAETRRQAHKDGLEVLVKRRAEVAAKLEAATDPAVRREIATEVARMDDEIGATAWRQAGERGNATREENPPIKVDREQLARDIDEANAIVNEVPGRPRVRPRSATEQRAAGGIPFGQGRSKPGASIEERAQKAERHGGTRKQAPEPERASLPKPTERATRPRLRRAIDEITRELNMLDELPERGAVREAVEIEQGLAEARQAQRTAPEGTRMRVRADAQVSAFVQRYAQLVKANSAVRQRYERKAALIKQRAKLTEQYRDAPGGENLKPDGDNVGGNLRPGEDERRQGWEGMIPGEPDPGRRPAGTDPKAVSVSGAAKQAAKERQKAVEKSGQDADIQLRQDVQKLQGMIDKAPALKPEHPDEPVGAPEGERSFEAEANASQFDVTSAAATSARLGAGGSAPAPSKPGTPPPAAPAAASGTRVPAAGKASPDLRDEDGNWRWEDAQTGEPIRSADQLRGYHESPDEAAFIRGQKIESEQDRTIGAPTAGQGYELDDLLGPLGEGRAKQSALERERRTTLRQLDEMVVGTHARRDGAGVVQRFQDREAAAKAAPKGWVPLAHRPERGDSSGSKEYVLVPDFIEKRVRSQVEAPGAIEAGGRLASRIAIRATLPFSVLWHAGNSVDLMARLALSLTPEELAKSGEVAAALERNLEKLSPELRAEVLSSLKGHFGSRETVRDPRVSDVVNGRIVPGFVPRVGRRNRKTTGEMRPAKQRGAASERLDATGNLWKNGPIARFTDRVFNISSEIEQAAATGRLGKSDRRVPNALGAAALRYARELGHHVDDLEHVASAVADELAGARREDGSVAMNHPAIAHLQDETLKIIGDFSTRSPAERKLMAGVDVYWTWLRESTRFVLKTLPMDHPKRTALMFMAASWTQEERLKAGVNYYWSDAELDKLRQHMPDVPERAEGYLLGAVGGEDALLPTAGLTSFGEVAGNLLEPRRLAGRLGSYAMRPAAAALGYYRTPQEVALRGLPDDVPLGLGEGETADLEHHGDGQARAGNMVAESAVPGLKQARILREGGGGTPTPNSTVVKPRVYRAKNAPPRSLSDRVVAATGLGPQPRRSSDPATTIQPDGPSYTITYRDPDTGQRVTRRIARKR